MREILFRGKRMDNGEWVEGYVFDNDFSDDKRYFVGSLVVEPDGGSKSYDFDITGMNFCEVDPETICQYTGLTDKNGKKIWEGDIISYQRDNDDCPFPNKDTKKRFGKVFYQGFRSTFAIGMGRNGSRSINDDLWKYVQNGNRVEVIGNVFDNPELLEV